MQYQEGFIKSDIHAENIQKLLDEKQWDEVREYLKKLHHIEISEIFTYLDRPQRAFIFRLLTKAKSSDVFSNLEPGEQNELLEDLKVDETKKLLASLEPDERTDLFEELPAQVTKRLLRLLSPQDLKESLNLLGYPEKSVGRLMTPEYVAVEKNWSIKQALEHIRKEGKDKHNMNSIYVVDKTSRLIDVLELRKFVLADEKDKVEDIMDGRFVSVSAFDDREVAVEAMREYDLSVLPVVDTEGVLLGIVTFDDVFEVAEEETTEDIQKSSAVAPLDTSYREASIWQLYRKRIGWLVALVIINLASSGVIAAYEEVLEAAIALAFFIPLLIDSGGNTGAQSATLMIRALATGDITKSQWFKAFSKEFGIGISLGLTLAIGGGALGLFRGGVEIGIIVGLTMIAIIFVSNLIGAILPFILSKLRVDPAVASGPLITSIADVAGLLMYFIIATQILKIFG